MTNTINADPTMNPYEMLHPDEMLRPEQKALMFQGNLLDVYQIPLPEGGEQRKFFDKVAVDNPEGFSRLVSGGLDALEDGETVTFAGVSQFDNPSEVRTVTRKGENFSVHLFQAYGEVGDVVPKEPGKQDDKPAPSLSGEQVNEFFGGLNANPSYINYMKDLAEFSGQIGDVVKALGYSDNNDTYPLPSTLKSNLDRMRSEGGADIPPIRLIEVGAIPTDSYNQAWEDGEFPVSNELGWFGHDSSRDHMRALIVFGGEAMGIAQLYAQAAKASETIITREYPDQYEINKGDQAQKIEITVSGEDKVDKTAQCLDQFTAELDGLMYSIHEDPNSEEFTMLPEHMDHIGEMVQVIMGSPEHKQQLLKHLEDVGSKAMVDDKFSYGVFLREILGRTQKRWGITPKPSVSDEPDRNDNDIF